MELKQWKKVKKNLNDGNKTNISKHIFLTISKCVIIARILNLYGVFKL